MLVCSLRLYQAEKGVLRQLDDAWAKLGWRLYQAEKGVLRQHYVVCCVIGYGLYQAEKGVLRQHTGLSRSGSGDYIRRKKGC